MTNQLLIVICTIITLLDKFPNAFVWATFWKFKSMLKKPKNILICSLVLFDFLQSVLACLLALDAAVSKHWTAGIHGCRFYGFMRTWLGLASILHHASMTAERCLLSPVRDFRLHFLKLFFMVHIGSYLVPFIVGWLPLVGWSGYDFEGNGHHCAIRWEAIDFNHMSFAIFVFTCFFFTLVLIIIIWGVKTYFAVRLIHLKAQESWRGDSPLTTASYRAEVKTGKIACMVTTRFFIAWLPYAVVLLLRVSRQTISLVDTEIPALLAKGSLIYNPIIYVFLFRRLRARSLSLIRYLYAKIPRRESQRFIPVCKRYSLGFTTAMHSKDKDMPAPGMYPMAD